MLHNVDSLVKLLEKSQSVRVPVVSVADGDGRLTLTQQVDSGRCQALNQTQRSSVGSNGAGAL